VKLFIKRGADVNLVPQVCTSSYFDVLISIKGRYSSFSPLHIACENGHMEIASMLLDYGANPNIKNEVFSD
jgi:ankyrin repeat protein